jgi:hypothetical protein
MTSPSLPCFLYRPRTVMVALAHSAGLLPNMGKFAAEVSDIGRIRLLHERFGR